jgi:hypothetical protein
MKYQLPHANKSYGHAKKATDRHSRSVAGVRASQESSDFCQTWPPARVSVLIIFRLLNEALCRESQRESKRLDDKICFWSPESAKSRTKHGLSFGHDLSLRHFVIFMLKGIASKQDNFQDMFLFSLLFNLFLPFQTLVFNRRHFTLDP